MSTTNLGDSDMKFRFIISISLFTICAFASRNFAQEKPQPTPTPQTPQRSMREIVMMPVVYRVAGMDKVKVKSDLKYTRAVQESV